MTRLTQQEIEMIKREAFDLYPHGLATPVKEGANIIRRIAHAKAATKYFLQLKEERERAGKLLEALEEIASMNQSANHGWDFMRIRKIAETAITEYKNNNQ